MSIYTIKKLPEISHQPSENSLLLLNEHGEEVSTLEILKETEPRRVFAFEGQMGAGKTTFIKKLCEEMGTTDIVNSPTFAIVNVYDVEQPYKGEVYHFDCYRLKDIREAVDFGAEEYLYSGNYCFIEWPERIAPLLPDDTVRVKITPMPDGSRKVEVGEMME
ncbi:MAG: tRNA (adenosine(37)-N6)-threonylcarbamoyltransferase complex ATPase subunit type 1 TsaE [Paludibacteraceae bacterium]|nr:tRNA (adenosine(37)-N6)-threonylcarbamoyltransferase complex ATPase subunit type 1 TsaE [Paludibacteraceae bacterium]